MQTSPVYDQTILALMGTLMDGQTGQSTLSVLPPEGIADTQSNERHAGQNKQKLDLFEIMIYTTFMYSETRTLPNSYSVALVFIQCIV